MGVDLHPVGYPVVPSPNTYVETTMNPADGGRNVHCLNLSTDFGTGAGSAVGSSGSMVALVATWTASQSWTKGQLILAPKSLKPTETTGNGTGAFLICSTGGAGATTGNGPTLSLGQTAITDGAAAKWDWLTDWFRNGILLTNADGVVNSGTNPLYYGPRNYIPSTLCDVVPPNGGKVVIPRWDPTNVFIFTAGAYAFAAYL